MSIIQIFIENKELHIVLGNMTIKGNKIPPASEGKFTNTHEQINGKSFEENKNRIQSIYNSFLSKTKIQGKNNST